MITAFFTFAVAGLFVSLAASVAVSVATIRSAA
jgi:hypothetical protein